MIGVIAKAGQASVVEEFFELFKTPWEFYEQGRSYDTVVATVDDIPEVNAKLLVVYGSETKSTDVPAGIKVCSRGNGGSLNYQGVNLPIYGDWATFSEEGPGILPSGISSRMGGIRTSVAGTTMIRLGYDLFQEVEHLLTAGQPVEHAHVSTLDIHISVLRDSIVREGIPLLEIPPAPEGHSFIVCLTHDIDFIGIRNHRFDHTMWGFLYRSTIGAIHNFVRRRISVRRLLEIWRAAASLPFVYLGWTKDFWSPFEWYLRVEHKLPATYFLIPFKQRAGECVPGRHASRRATAYDVGDLLEWAEKLRSEGCELGVHGIDAWRSIEKGRAELARIAEVTGESEIGIRVHWLLQDSNTPSVLEKSGYAYDSTAGYNETIGYRSGTTQVFRPLRVESLLELPMHIQDGALFYRGRLDLPESEAGSRCEELVKNAGLYGGVLTILWHDRSHGPERFWGDFYVRFVESLKCTDAWFATGTQAVRWFRKRRNVRFSRISNSNGARIVLDCEKVEPSPALRLRVYRPSTGTTDGRNFCDAATTFSDVPWSGTKVAEFDSSRGRTKEIQIGPAVFEACR